MSIRENVLKDCQDREVHLGDLIYISYKLPMTTWSFGIYSKRGEYGSVMWIPLSAWGLSYVNSPGICYTRPFILGSESAGETYDPSIRIMKIPKELLTEKQLDYYTQIKAKLSNGHTRNRSK